MSIKANKTDKQNVVYNHIKRVIYNYQKYGASDKSTWYITCGRAYRLEHGVAKSVLRRSGGAG